MKLAICRIALLLALCLPTHFGIAAESIYDALIQQGVELSADETTKLPPPLLADGLAAAAQRQAIESLLAGRYEWDQFTRKSVVSPLLLKIDDLDRESGQVSRRADLYFVAYGKLDIFGDDRKLQEHLNLASAGDSESAGSHVTLLTADELAKRGLSASQTTDPNHAGTRWVAVEATLLNKVQLNLTTRNEKLETDHSLLVASASIPSSRTTTTIPTAGARSRSTTPAAARSARRNPTWGSVPTSKPPVSPSPPAPCSSNTTSSTPNQHGWFHGANLLRSKLPIVAQDVVRKLRRKMAEQ